MNDVEQVFWGIHVTGDDGDTLFLKKGFVGLGWKDIGDLGKLAPTRDAFKAKIAEKYPNTTNGWRIQAASQLFRFVREMGTGDFVVYRSKVDRLIHVGQVTGDYQYRPDLHDEFVNVRPVKWEGHYPLTLFSQGALYELGSALTLFQVRNYADEYRAALGGVSAPVPPPSDATAAEVEHNVAQTARDFIFKQLAQHTKGYGFQSFVAHLISTMGYRTSESAPGTDEGIDIIAYRDELKLQPPIIKVQVKSTEGTVGGPEVKQLIGNLSQQECGLLVTLGSFSRQARDAVKSKSNIRLIDAEELIDLILAHYEQLDPRYKALFPLKRVYIPEPVSEDAS